MWANMTKSKAATFLFTMMVLNGGCCKVSEPEPGLWWRGLINPYSGLFVPLATRDHLSGRFIDRRSHRGTSLTQSDLLLVEVIRAVCHMCEGENVCLIIN